MSKYKQFTEEEIEELNSNYLIDSWSYSKVTSFARNEKAFEMQSIYRLYGKKGVSTVAGEAYHYAVSMFFEDLKNTGEVANFEKLESFAFYYIDECKSQYFKLGKKTPTVEQFLIEASKTAVSGLKNFYSESNLYTDEIYEILGVEERYSEFLTINGVDIPLKCNAVVDLRFLNKQGKQIIVDHKLRSFFSNEEDLKFTAGSQAITYVKCVESKFNIPVDEVWIVENKTSQNRDKSKQLNAFKIEINPEITRLYEAILYEPLRRMVSAVSDPDYVYVMNDNDTFTDKAEVYNFWCRTMVCEIGDFNVDETKKKLVEKRLKKIRDSSLANISPKIFKDFQKESKKFIQYDLSDSSMTMKEKIEHVLRSFGAITEVKHEYSGYSSDTFLLSVSAGVKVASISKYNLDIANVLDVSNVRISKELVVVNGKSFISIEIPKKRDRDVLYDASLAIDGMIPLGRDNFDDLVFWDLKNHSTPHVLICGSTGSGKTASMISTVNYAKLAGVEDVYILDPKYDNDFANVECATVVNEVLEIEELMEKLVVEMERRVQVKENKLTMIIFDEFADAVMNSRKGAELDIKELVQIGVYKQEKGIFAPPPQPKMALKKVGQKKSLAENLLLLLQKGRSVGFRIVCATQRASVNVIKGDAKVNFPIQMCFRVPKAVDSQVILDEAGGECLAGQGDCLINSPEVMQPVRFQAFYKPN